MNVFWDWNGTLCDDVRLSLDAVNDMLARRGRSGITMEEYYSYMGTPISKFYEHLFDFSVEPMEGLSREFYSYYQANTHILHLREGAEAVLKRLRDLGARQFILSSSHKDSILPLASRWGILPYFEAVLGAEDWKVGSKAERARQFCCEKGLCREETWFIGDLLHDLETALHCDASCILLSGGHQSDGELQATGCFCASASEIPSVMGL